MSKSEFTFSKPILSKSVIYCCLPLKPIRGKVTVNILGIFATLFNFIGYVSSNVKKNHSELGPVPGLCLVNGQFV